MAISFDKAFGTLPDSLLVKSRRAELLAANLANSDTPGYKAKDLDFASIFKGSMEGGSLAMTATAKGHIQPEGVNNLAMAEKYRIPLQSSLDGNTVNTQLEKSEFSKNSVQYQATLELLGSKFKGLFGAIRGE